MKWLIAVLAAIGAASVAGVLLRRRSAEAAGSAWTQATETASSSAKTAADKSAGAASAAADEVKDAVTH